MNDDSPEPVGGSGMMRRLAAAECLWCHGLIEITCPEENLPAELLDSERPFTLETLVRISPVIPEQEGVDVLGLLDGRTVVIHTDCALALVCTVATAPDGAERLQRLRSKDEQDRKPK